MFVLIIDSLFEFDCSKLGGFLMQVVANVGCHWTLGARIPYMDKTFQAYLENFRSVADLMHHCSCSALVPSLNPISSKIPQMLKLEKEFQV